MQKFDNSVSCLCWAYNEEPNIRVFLDRITALLDSCIADYEIVFIDDCSTDKTNRIATDFATTNSRLRIFRNEQNMNVGYSLRRAVECATKEYLFWQTVDWSYDISDLRNHLEWLKKYDVVLGVRRKPVIANSKPAKLLTLLVHLFGIKHLTRRSDTVHKAFISVVNYLLIRMLFRVPASDFQNVVFYPTRLAQAIQVTSNSAFINPEHLLKSYWLGKSIKEVPIDFIRRTSGEAKGTKPKAVMMAILDILRLYFKMSVLGIKGPYTLQGIIHRS